MEKGHSLQGREERGWGSRHSRKEALSSTLGTAGLQGVVRGVLRQKGRKQTGQSILCPKGGTQAAEITCPWPQVDLDSRCLTPTLDVLTFCWNPERKHTIDERRRGDIPYWCSGIWASVRNELKLETM